MAARGVVGYEFEEYFNFVSLVKSYYNGVFSINQIPNNIKIKHFVIINLSPSNEPGTHWVTLFRSGKKIYELFNSLGFQNLDLIEKYLKFGNNVTVEFNESAFQSPTSTSCGLFCIYFAIHRCLNYDQNFSLCLEDSFASSPEQNENTVKTFCQKLKEDTRDSFLFS